MKYDIMCTGGKMSELSNVSTRLFCYNVHCIYLQLITEELSMNLDNLEPEMLGSCKKVTVLKDDTVVLDGAGDKKSI
ncbi:putative groEL-like apical domain superfamily protein [Helianthus anomalus]